jgi:hypothetical protein
MRNYLPLTVITLSSLLFLFLAYADAEAKTFSLKDATVKMDVPASWQVAKNLFGMPLTILGPESGGGRPVIVVTPLNMPNVTFDSESLKANENEYREGRQKWLEKMEGQAISFGHYELNRTPAGNEVHSMGFRYKLAGREFVEDSNYIRCKGNFYHVKTILHATHEAKFASVVQKAVKSFSCN